MISAVIVTYHTGAVLDLCLEAVLAAEDVGEVILVDNGNPADVLDRLHQLAEQNTKLRVLTGHGNVGFSRGCNTGASEAQGDHLLFLNPDAVLPSGVAELLVKAGEDQSQDDWAAGPRLLNPDGSEQRGSRRTILTPWNAFVEATRLYRLMPNHPHFERFNSHEDSALTAPTQVPCLSGAAFVVPLATWQKLQGFDERFFLHVEDVDFFLRLNRIGGAAIYVPGAEIIHHKSSSQVDPLFVERRKKQSLNLYFATHFKDVYPPGFLTLLRGLLWLSFSWRSVARRLRKAPR
ncbi:MAG: glycosyltransferase family 2 protein [Pseudomonadota bacterium]